MRKSFDALRQFAPSRAAARDPRFVMRLILGALLLANLVALWLVISPPGGSVEDLETQLASMRSESVQKKAALERLRTHAGQVDKSRASGQQFETQYFTDRRVASSTFVAELTKAAVESGMRPKEHTFLFDLLDGSDVLTMMTINANYEGTYGDLLQFINRLDRSSRFLILDSLGATPQQSGGMLNVNVKLNAFVKEVPGQL